MQSRREILKTFARAASVLALSVPGQRAMAHNAAGIVKPPLAVPPVKLVLHNGRQTTLREILTGRTTALQLMFTGCSAVCPIQGALFASVDSRLGAQTPALPNAQLLSVSIDPLGDDARALQAWRQRFDAGRLWTAASPAVKDLDPWLDFLQGRSQGADRHTAQVYFFNTRAELVLRTVDFAPAPEIVKLLNALSAQG